MRIGLGVLVFAILTLASATTALRAETFIPGEEINKRGVTFRVAPYGDMRLSRISIGERPNNECLVQIEGLQSAVIQSIRGKSLRYRKNSDETITITIDLQRTLNCKHPQTGERTACCVGQGEGCRATIEVPKQVTGRVMEALGA